jgi:molybdate transport system substrate-binding protein
MDWLRRGVGMAVKAGSPRPDISSSEAVKKALLSARAVAYSTVQVASMSSACSTALG